MKTRTAVATVLLVLAAGCSRAPRSADFDSDLSTEMLIVVLDAWKQGRAETLLSQEPPIRFVDDDWSAGLQLENYEFEPPRFWGGPDQDVKVVLVLKNSLGVVQRKPATYQVTLVPRRAVLRSDS